MRATLMAAVVAMSVGVATGASADAGDHVVTAAEVEARLADAAGGAGIDVEALRAAVPALTEAELQDLARRAAALETDPVAGVRTWVWVVGGVLALLVLIAISAANYD